VTARVLSVGGLRELRWLRRRLGDEAIAAFLTARKGRGLSPERLRYWEAVLGLPHRAVSSWLRDPARAVWDRRAG
jgi:hypothetical protein